MAILLSSDKPQVLRVTDLLGERKGVSKVGIPTGLLTALAGESLCPEAIHGERQRLLEAKCMGSVSARWPFMGRFENYYPGEKATYTRQGEDFRPGEERSRVNEGWELIDRDNTAILFASGVQRLEGSLFAPYYSLHARVTSFRLPSNSPEVVLGSFANQVKGALDGNVVSVQDPKDGDFKVSHWEKWRSPEVYVYNLGFVGNNPGYPYRHRLTVESHARIPEVLFETLCHTATFIGTLYTVAGQNPPEFTVADVINEGHYRRFQELFTGQARVLF